MFQIKWTQQVNTMEGKPPSGKIRGRITEQKGSSILVLNEQGSHWYELQSTENVRLGDLIEIHHQVAQVLTPNRSPNSSLFWPKTILSPRRIHALKVRQRVESTIRNFFSSQGFHETRTPLLVPCPGMETHIRPFLVQSTASPQIRHYLPTSPEFAMKRLLVGGLEKIFQISHAFRDEPTSKMHHPEFTLLEWYRAYSTEEEIMRDTETLLETLAHDLFGKPELEYQGQTISVKAPWPRLRIRDLFESYVGISLIQACEVQDLRMQCHRLGLQTQATDTWDDLYFRIWLNCIEPRLPTHQAVFVTRFPKSQAALSLLDSDPDGSLWARRFEIYAGGLELGNAFAELTDPMEQRKRFEKDMALRVESYGPNFPPNPLDEEFLAALTEGMPPSGGIAVGVDRLVMLYANEPEIHYTTWLESASFNSSQSEGNGL